MKRPRVKVGMIIRETFSYLSLCLTQSDIDNAMCMMWQTIIKEYQQII